MVHLKNILERLSYTYYPFGVPFLNEEGRLNEGYRKTIENIKLEKAIASGNLIKFDTLINELRSIVTDKNVRDLSGFHFGDRSSNIQISKENENSFVSLCINISVLIPYFTIYVISVDIDPITRQWINNDNAFKRNLQLEKSNEYSTLIKKIKKIISNEYRINYFPDELFNEIIPNIATEETEYGKVSFFNAFFLDKFYTSN